MNHVDETTQTGWTEALLTLNTDEFYDENGIRGAIRRLEKALVDGRADSKLVAMLEAIQHKLLDKLQHLELEAVAKEAAATPAQSYQVAMQAFVASVLASLPAAIRRELPSEWEGGYKLVMTHALMHPERYKDQLISLINSCNDDCRTTGRYLTDPLRNGILICDPDGDLCSLADAVVATQLNGEHRLMDYQSYHVLTGPHAGRAFDKSK